MKFLQSRVSCYKNTEHGIPFWCLCLQTSCNDKLQNRQLGCIIGSSGILPGAINIATILTVGHNYLVFHNKISKY